MNDDRTPRRFAAAAPIHDDDDVPVQTLQDHDLHARCEAWVHWCHSRRLYGQASNPPSLLGQLCSKTRGPSKAGGPDAACSAELAAFHLAYLCQPDELDKRIFEAHYVQRVKPIKAAARALGVSRAQWYVRLSAFRERVHALAQDLRVANGQQLAAMQRARLDRAVPLDGDETI